jgi:hypothetical protein
VSGTPHEAKDESARTSQTPATSPAGVENPESCVRPSSSYTRTQDLEAAAVWDRLGEKLRASHAPSEPKVSKVELQIIAEPEPIVDDVSVDEPTELATDCHFDADETPAELTIELDPEDERESIAMRAIEYGYEFDAEGNIERIPPGVPDEFHEALWRTQHEAQHERLNE